MPNKMIAVYECSLLAEAIKYRVAQIIDNLSVSKGADFSLHHIADSEELWIKNEINMAQYRARVVCGAILNATESYNSQNQIIFDIKTTPAITGTIVPTLIEEFIVDRVCFNWLKKRGVDFVIDIEQREDDLKKVALLGEGRKERKYRIY